MDNEASIVKIASKELFPFVEELMRDGKNVRITVRGNSMYPFIRSGTDDVLLRTAAFPDLKRLDIVFVKRDNGAYVLHRVCAIKGNVFFMVGDAQKDIEGPLRSSQVIAKVDVIFRGQHVIRCDAKKWRFFASFWMFLRPVRVKIIKAVQFFYNRFLR